MLIIPSYRKLSTDLVSTWWKQWFEMGYSNKIKTKINQWNHNIKKVLSKKKKNECIFLDYSLVIVP